MRFPRAATATTATAAALLAGFAAIGPGAASAASMDFRNCSKDSILLHGFHKIDTERRLVDDPVCRARPDRAGRVHRRCL